MKQKLEEKIEQKRKELIITARQTGFTSKDTLKLSEELDCLINGYNSLESEYLPIE